MNQSDRFIFFFKCSIVRNSEREIGHSESIDVLALDVPAYITGDCKGTATSHLFSFDNLTAMA